MAIGVIVLGTILVALVGGIAASIMRDRRFDHRTLCCHCTHRPDMSIRQVHRRLRRGEL